MSTIKVGDRVRNCDAKSVHYGATGTVVDIDSKCISIRRDDGSRGSGIYGSWTARPECWELIPAVLEVAEPVPQADDWSYAEAERLYQAACAAIETYNQYIERKPTTNYLSAGLPSKW